MLYMRFFAISLCLMFCALLPFVVFSVMTPGIIVIPSSPCNCSSNRYTFVLDALCLHVLTLHSDLGGGGGGGTTSAFVTGGLG